MLRWTLIVLGFAAELIEGVHVLRALKAANEEPKRWDGSSLEKPKRYLTNQIRFSFLYFLYSNFVFLLLKK